MDLFVDTNILLNFFHYSSDDLEELKKLAVLLEAGEVRLVMPRQTIDEFRRNREAKIADALKRLKETRLSSPFPQIAKDYPEFEALRRLQRAFGQNLERLLESIETDAREWRLKADVITDSLFRAAHVVETTPELLALARTRSETGNPPGKRGSLGDAINWEALLQEAGATDDLHFVSGDGDYASELDPDRLASFLDREWNARKFPSLVFYTRLSAFFQAEFPDIKLAADAEVDFAIRDLALSSSFTETHGVVARLQRIAQFSSAQAKEIVDASLGNSQVYWIATDSDVNEFLHRVAHEHADELDEESLTQLHQLLSEDDDDAPAEDDPDGSF